MKKDEWHYESDKIIIERVGEQIYYKIKEESKKMYEYIRKNFEYVNNYLKKPITQKEFKRMFKDEVNILHIKINKDDFNCSKSNPHVCVICECNGVYKEIVIPEYWKKHGWDKYKNAGIDFEDCASEKAYFIAPELDEDEIRTELKYHKEVKEDHIFNYNADVDKDQINIFSFI